MFHFWFNTFFATIDHEEHTVSLKPAPDGHGQTPRSTTPASNSTKLHSTVPSTKPTPTVASSGRLPQSVGISEPADRRTLDRVVKAAADRTASGTSSASGSTRGSLSHRRPSQTSSASGSTRGSVSLRRSSLQNNAISSRPHSALLSDALPDSETAASVRSDPTVASKMSKNPRDKLQSSSVSATSPQHSRPLHSQEPKSVPVRAVAQVNGFSKTGSQEGRKTPGGESSGATARRGSSGPRNSEGGAAHRAIGRSDSARLSRTGDVVKTTPDHSRTLRPTTSVGGGQRPTKNETSDQRAKPLMIAGMKKASSTVVLSRTAKTYSVTSHGVRHPATTDSATSRSVRQPIASTQAQSSVPPRYTQRDTASRHVVSTNKTGTSKQMVYHGERRGSGGSGSSLVSPAMQSRSKGVPVDQISLTRYTPRYTQRNPRQYTSATLLSSRSYSRQSSAPAESRSSAVLEVSGSSSRPSTFFTLTLPKSEIDKASKDVQHKIYSSDFKVSA